MCRSDLLELISRAESDLTWLSGVLGDGIPIPHGTGKGLLGPVSFKDNEMGPADSFQSAGCV